MVYNEPYSLSDPPSDQFPFLRRRDEDEKRQDQPVPERPYCEEHGSIRPRPVGQDRRERTGHAHRPAEVHQGDCKEEV